MTDQEALALLQRARKGDAGAEKAVAVHCYDHFLPRLRRLASKNADVAMSLEDMEQAFFEGCWRAVLVADDRGDPLYHIGQRGIWAVQSLMRSVRRVTRAQAGVWAGMNDERRDPVANAPDPRAPDAFSRVEDALVARQRVHVLVTAPLKPRLRQAVDAILSGAAGDPDEIGFNARLAVAMGVSPQRTSQVMAELRGLVQ